MLDYATLRIIWWVLLGLLLIAFAVMDGFDLGIGMLLHRVARTNDERRVVINTIGPVWEGNQVWLILGAGTIFAAWPMLYAVSFSGFYFVMMIILLGLIIRPVGFKYRSKVESTRWRALWDLALFINGFLPALLFGVAVGNVLQGVPFHFDPLLRSYYTGNLIDLMNPFALLCGLLSISMLVMHGGIFLAIKTNVEIQQRAIQYAKLSAIVTMILFVIAGIWIITNIQGYVVVSHLVTDGPSNPLYKKVMIHRGAWAFNYAYDHKLLFVPLLGFASVMLARILLHFRTYKSAWIASAIGIAGMISTVGVSMFPFILPSSTHPDMSLLVWDASSSQLTLLIMLIVTVVFLPLIILYTSWVYHVLRGKVTVEYVSKNKTSTY